MGPRPRVALVLTSRTQAEFVAAVTLLAASEISVDVVVPALDADAVARWVETLLGPDAAVTVEPVHAYLRAGHDHALLAERDPAARGRALALAARALGANALPDGSAGPAEVVAALAESTSLDLPEEIRADVDWVPPAVPAGDGLVALRTPWGAPMLAPQLDRRGTPWLAVGGGYDPAGVAFLERLVSPGDVAVDLGAGIGLFTVLLARAVGHTGRVVAYPSDPALRSVLEENLALNRVTGWCEIRDRDRPPVPLAPVGDRPVAVLRLDAGTASGWGDGLLTLPASAGPGRVRTVVTDLVGASPGGAAVVAQAIQAWRGQLGGTVARVDGDGLATPLESREAVGPGLGTVVVSFPEPPTEAPAEPAG